MFETRVQKELFSLEREHQRLAGLGPSVGAIVSFTGQVRDTPLFLEHYPRMAEQQMAHTMVEARKRWPLLGAIAIHRYGALDVGEQIVLVLTAASHRGEAFQAAEFLMDWLKTRAPFWKRGPDGWVAARDSDAVAAARWEQELQQLKG